MAEGYLMADVSAGMGHVPNLQLPTGQKTNRVEQRGD